MKKTYIALKPFNNRVFYNNAVFNSSLPTSSPYLIAARKLLAKNNLIMDTIDIAPKTLTRKYIYLDVPYPWQLKLWIRLLKNISKNILFIIEAPVVNPFSHTKLFHIFFKKIYTWNDDLVDNKKYFKFVIPKSSKGIDTKTILFKKKEFLTMMNGNWLPFFPFRLLSLSTKELYSKRIKAIEFFDKNIPLDFSLFGRGWNKPQKYSIKQRLFGYHRYKTFRGEFNAKEKYAILSRFKYALCFENSKITGYISEKIFDCFKAKCVPVYYGAPNIDKYIPPNCYIDARNFDNYQALYDHLKNIREKEYNIYINRIQTLLKNREFLQRWFERGFSILLLKLIKGR